MISLNSVHVSKGQVFLSLVVVISRVSLTFFLRMLKLDFHQFFPVHFMIFFMFSSTLNLSIKYGKSWNFNEFFDVACDWWNFVFIFRVPCRLEFTYRALKNVKIVQTTFFSLSKSFLNHNIYDFPAFIAIDELT